MMALDILFYADGRGSQAVYEGMQELEKREPVTYRKVYYALILVSESGEDIRSGKIKRDNRKRLKGTNNIWQLRISKNRVLFFFYGNQSIVLTNQFKKKTDKTPANEISRAETRKE